MTTFREKYLGDKTFYKQVAAVAIPSMAQQLLASFVNLVDNLIVASLGSVALSGVTAANRFFMICLFALNALIGTVTVFLAQYYGAKDKNNQQEVFRIGISVALVCIVPFFLAALFVPSGILSLLSHDAEVIHNGSVYLRMVTWSYLPLPFSLMISNCMRAIGDSKTPLYMSMVAIFLNTFLSFTFVLGLFGVPKMGVFGAALGTFIARVVELSLLSWISLKRRYNFIPNILTMLKVKFKLMITILKKAFPLMVNEIGWSLGMTVLFALYSSLGLHVQTAYSMTITISDMFFVLFSGMAATCTVFVAQPLGADDKDKAKTNANRLFLLSIIASLFLGVFLICTSSLFPKLFSETAEIERQITSRVLLIHGIFYPIFAVTGECYFTLRVGGDMKSILFLDSGYMWFVNIPLVFILIHFTDWSVYIVYLCSCFTEVVKIMIAYRMFRQEKWVINLTQI